VQLGSKNEGVGAICERVLDFAYKGDGEETLDAIFWG